MFLARGVLDINGKRCLSWSFRNKKFKSDVFLKETNWPKILQTRIVYFIKTSHHNTLFQ